MSSIINLKKEILKVVFDAEGDVENMNIDNVVKLSEDVKEFLKKEELKKEILKELVENSIDNNNKITNETINDSNKYASVFDVANNLSENADYLSVFEAESDTIFQRMRKAHEKRELDNIKYKESIKKELEENEKVHTRREYLKDRLLNRLN